MVTLIFEKALNPLYLYEAVQDQIQASFNSSQPRLMLLADFLTRPLMDEVRAQLSASGSKDIFVPHRYSFTEVECTLDLFSSKDFLHFIRSVTGIKSSHVRVSVKEFGHQNFTLLHDDVDARARVVFFYTLGGKNWKREWGGQTIFTFGDEREPVVFEPKSNSLAIIQVPKGMRDFVKYIPHFAGANKFIKIEGILS